MPREVGENRRAQGFRADVRSQAEAGPGFGETVLGPFAAEDFVELFAALGEGAFDEARVGGGKFGGDEGFGKAIEPKTGGGDVGRWKEAGSRNAKAGACGVGAGDEQGEDTVVAGARLSAESIHDFGLQGDGDRFRGIGELSQFDQDGGADGVREIGDDGPSGGIRLNAGDPGEGVVVEDLELGMVAKSLVEKRDEAGIFLDGEDPGARLEEVLGEGSETGADFEDLVARLGIGEADDAAELVGVVEEILSEGAGEAEAVLGQQATHFAEGHVAFL